MKYKVVKAGGVFAGEFVLVRLWREDAAVPDDKTAGTFHIAANADNVLGGANKAFGEICFAGHGNREDIL